MTGEVLRYRITHKNILKIHKMKFYENYNFLKIVMNMYFQLV